MKELALTVITGILAATVPVVVIVGLWSRKETGKGIGWQFIRYTVLAVSLPIIAILALYDLLSGEAAALIGAAMGFAFGKADSDSS